MRARNTPYPIEFGQQMVELVEPVEAGRKPGELAKEFGCHETTISGWVRQAQADQTGGISPNASLTRAERQELLMLRRQLRQVQQERDILAKATAWFANKDNMALTTRRPHEVIHHSDRGSQYTSVAFGKRCEQMGVRPSMGSVGDAYDNAMAESFFASLECELINRRTSKTKAQARMEVFRWIEAWYNPLRLHSGIDY